MSRASSRNFSTFFNIFRHCWAIWTSRSFVRASSSGRRKPEDSDETSDLAVKYFSLAVLSLSFSRDSFRFHLTSDSRVFFFFWITHTGPIQVLEKPSYRTISFINLDAEHRVYAVHGILTRL